MLYCLNTSTIKPQSLIDKILLAGKAGYDGIELWLNDVFEHVARGGEVSDVEKAISDNGLIVPSVIAMRQWGDFQGWEHQLVMDEARRRFALGARLGAPFIVATPPMESIETEHLPERYRELLEIGREEGIRPTFEYISFFQSV
ncbi:MAG: TIM barrel protein, partial [Opitutae bacterium]|nr:TIM barrel protein [Opitutae bacterium]